jgi:hypothetical protein
MNIDVEDPYNGDHSAISSPVEAHRYADAITMLEDGALTFVNQTAISGE